MNIRTFYTDRFIVSVTAEPDYNLDPSWDEDGSVRRDLESGKLSSFCVKAAVTYRGREIATDYLGGCIYAHPREFMDHRECGKQNREYAARGETGRCGSYFSDMVKTVCQEARKTLADMQTARVRSNHPKEQARAILARLPQKGGEK